MNQNNSHLIAGFFRYHREKLNYSLRGLVGDGKVVDLSSLSAFEQGKKILTEEQLIALFRMLGCDYIALLKSYDYQQEYKILCEYIYLADIKQAVILFKQCESNGVFDSLGCMNFALIQYVLSSINNKLIEFDSLCIHNAKLYTSEQKVLLKIADAYRFKNSGCFEKAIETLKEVEKISFDSKLRAFISQQFGVYYGLLGNYAEATVSLLDAKRRYGELLALVPLIQVNLSLGTVYFLTNSYSKAEEAYTEAYRSILLLKNSSHLLTKCFNSLCWFYFNTNQYNKVNELLNDKLDILHESTNTYFVLSWASYKVGNSEDAVKYSLEGQKKFSNDEYACTVYKYIENAALGKKTGQDALLKKAIEMKNKENSNEFNELLIREIIDIYERRKNYEKAFKYAKKLLNR